MSDTLIEKWMQLTRDSKGEYETELEFRVGSRTRTSFDSIVDQPVAKLMIEILVKHPEVVTWARLEILDQIYSLAYGSNDQSLRHRIEQYTVRDGKDIKERTTEKIILKTKVQEEDYRVAGRVNDCRFSIKKEKAIAKVPADATRVSGRQMVRFSFWTKDGLRLDISEVRLTRPTNQLIPGQAHYECEGERFVASPITRVESVKSSMQEWFARIVPERDDGLFMRLDSKLDALVAAAAVAAARAAATGTATAPISVAKAIKPQSAIVKNYFFIPWVR